MLWALSLLAATPVAPCTWSEFRPARQLRGVYVDDFENQRFYEHATVPADIRRGMRFAWFDRSQARSSGTMEHWPRGRVYRVIILGRESFPAPISNDPRRPCPPDNGEISRITVTQILARDDLGAIPRSLP